MARGSSATSLYKDMQVFEMEKRVNTLFYENLMKEGYRVSKDRFFEEFILSHLLGFSAN